jgi:hypothetical protein
MNVKPSEFEPTAGRNPLVDQLLQAAVATFDLFGVYLGDRLGDTGTAQVPAGRTRFPSA